MTKQYYPVLTFLFVASLQLGSCSGHSYGKGFFNHTGCLYAYLEGGNFELTLPDGEVINEKLSVEALSYDTNRTKCTKENRPGRIVFTFDADEKSKFSSISISMRISPSLSEGYWEISKANVTVSRSDTDRKRTFPLKVSELQAGTDYSFSCNELRLQTINRKKPDNETGRADPSAIVTLDRFQLQPFPELKNYVFAPSFDCSTWVSLPCLMGLILVSFMASIIIVGVRLLKSIETNDFKQNKQGQMFTQSQMETNKRQ